MFEDSHKYWAILIVREVVKGAIAYIALKHNPFI